MCDKHCASSAEKGACLILSPMLLCANNNKSKLAKIKTETKQNKNNTKITSESENINKC